MGHPLARLLVVVQIARFDLNHVDHPATFCYQIEDWCGKDGMEIEKPAETKAWAATLPFKLSLKIGLRGLRSA